MAFTIELQTNLSEKTSLDKQLSTVLQISGTLREGTSIIDPVITIEGDMVSLIGVNYMTIPIFGRSYFIQNMRVLVNGLIEINAHCDVLSSFKSQIRSNTAIVRRQENNWNLYLNDGTFKVYQNPVVLTKPFPNGFGDFNFILAIAGG